MSSGLMSLTKWFIQSNRSVDSGDVPAAGPGDPDDAFGVKQLGNSYTENYLLPIVK